MQVLLVEDERGMAELLKQGLSEEGHAVVIASSGPEGLSIARSFVFDVILLDVMLPGFDGFTLAARLREARNQTPILFLTARDTLLDRVKGLDLGGDDYLVKPFAFEELLARLRAVSRRGPIPQQVCLQVSDLVLNTTSRQVTRKGETIVLTPTEYSLLEMLMRRKGQVVARSAILSGVWGYDKDVEPNTLEAFVRLVRNKIDAGYEPKLIQTVRGIGYCVREPDR